ncbi:MAG: hypothetical protein WC767_04015 [Candidatus Paceibacterota bacterium]|jgi:hypothetical protein
MKMIFDLLRIGLSILIQNKCTKLPSHSYCQILTGRIDELIMQWMPLLLLSRCGLDVWYATDVLGLKFDYFYSKSNPDDYHFRGESGRIIKPSDYGHPKVTEPLPFIRLFMS